MKSGEHSSRTVLHMDPLPADNLPHLLAVQDLGSRVVSSTVDITASCPAISSRTVASCSLESSIQQVNIRLNTWSSPQYGLSDRHQHTAVQSLIGTTGELVSGPASLSVVVVVDDSFSGRATMLVLHPCPFPDLHSPSFLKHCLIPLTPIVGSQASITSREHVRYSLQITSADGISPFANAVVC